MSSVVAPIVDSTAVFRSDIFKGKVLFCTGGGSGICRGMTEAVVWVNVFHHLDFTYLRRCVMGRMPPLWAGSACTPLIQSSIYLPDL